MTYGLSPALFVENGPAVTAASIRARRGSLWAGLDPDRRIALIDSALRPHPANDDRPDEFPVAL